MILPDINVLVYAFEASSPPHEAYRDWLDKQVEREIYALANIVLSGFIRITTHPRIFDNPAHLTKASAFCENLRRHPNCVTVNPGPAHFAVFATLCEQIGARANDVTDAYLAALAIEHGCEFVTADKDSARFTGLRWRHPFG